MSSISYDIAHAPPEVLQHLANTPSIPPPVGVTPNFVDPVNTGNIQIIVSAVMFAFTILFFLNRVYVKVFLIRKITWDDGMLFYQTYLGTATDPATRDIVYSYGRWTEQS